MKKIDMRMEDNNGLWNNFGRTEVAVAEGTQRGGFYLAFSIVTVLRSVMDNKANGHRSTPVWSTIDTRTTFGLTA